MAANERGASQGAASSEGIDGAPESGVSSERAGDASFGPKSSEAGSDEWKDFGAVAAQVREAANRLDRSDELGALIRAAGAGHVEAGPSGVASRGRVDVMPSGRNFFGLDPRLLPTEAAWILGVELAAKVVHKRLHDEGAPPESVAMFWMCNDLMWADGEGMAQILAFLGVRPVWSPAGLVEGLALIPLEELGRPRIDVTIRVSGLLRDSFPRAVELIDDAVTMVAALDEDPEDNFVRKHVLARIEALGADLADKDKWREATWRVFCSEPGVYQAGVNLSVLASAWRTAADLTDVFVHWNGWAYGRGGYGVRAPRALESSLATVDVTWNKVVSDEHDLLGCCGYFGTHGGLSAAASHIKGSKVKDYYGDTREPQAPSVRDLADEVRRVVRGKLLDPKWIEGMKRHGYKGAGDISKRAGRVYGWEATTESVDDWIFDEMAKTFVLNDENRDFFERENPWALEEIARRLLEAQARGLWKADPEVLEGLRSRYLDLEGILEESTESFGGDLQGGSVDIVTAADVERWRAVLEQARSEKA